MKSLNFFENFFFLTFWMIQSDTKKLKLLVGKKGSGGREGGEGFFILLFSATRMVLWRGRWWNTLLGWGWVVHGLLRVAGELEVEKDQ